MKIFKLTMKIIIVILALIVVGLCAYTSNFSGLALFIAGILSTQYLLEAE